MSPRSTATSGKTSKPAVKTAGGKSTATKTRPARPRVNKTGLVSPEERVRLIAEAAYFKAAQRGFASGGELEDWVEAEAEIDALLDSRGAG